MIHVWYHRDVDGAYAAVAAYHQFRDTAEYTSVQYGEDVPDIKLHHDDEVYIVDFSYSREILDKIDSVVSKLVVLDHHKTAQAALLGTSYSIFDMSKCGSTLAWEYFRDSPMPELYEYVEDRDLWTNALEHTSAIAEAMKLYSLTDIAKLYTESESDGFLEDLIITGNILLRYKASTIARFTSKKNDRIKVVDWKDRKWATYNTIDYISDIPELVREIYDVETTISYMFLTDKVVFNLRSVGDIDVSAIALLYGGGGHRNASGFTLSIEDAMELIDSWLID